MVAAAAREPATGLPSNPSDPDTPRRAGWLRALRPKPDASLENRLFQLITFMWGVIALGFVAPTNGMFIPSIALVGSTLVLGAFGVFSLAAWWRARDGHCWVGAFFVAHLAALDALWFPGGGSTGATLLFYFSLILLPVVFAAGATRVVMMLAIAVNVVVVYALELAHPDWLVLHASPAQRILDIGATTLIVLAGMAATIAVIVRGYHAERQRLAGVNAELARALADVRSLQGILRMCAWCRRIRTDEGGWLSVESYVSSHRGVRMSHGLCPECSTRVLAEIDADDVDPTAGVRSPDSQPSPA
jgi:hypothetical protein